LWIEKERKRRWLKGIQEYRGGDASAPFNGQGLRALDHFLQEHMDGKNYLDQAARNGELTAWAACEIDVRMHEIVNILEADVLRMKHALASQEVDGPEAA
jgi:hypothetical protein